MSNSFFNSNDIITLPSETFYSCNKNLCFENDTFITTKDNSFNSFIFNKDIKEMLDNKVDEFWTHYRNRTKKETNKVLYDIEDLSYLELDTE